MNQTFLRKFREVWCIDFEFSAPPGERPTPICLVAWEINSERKLKIWEDELLNMKEPPYATEKDSLVVAYYASAEIGCHLSLGWPLPTNILDLFVDLEEHFLESFFPKTVSKSS